jgi:hypothetical protein
MKVEVTEAQITNEMGVVATVSLVDDVTIKVNINQSICRLERLVRPHRRSAPGDVTDGGEAAMTEKDRLKCLTTASWLLGYAEGLDLELHEALANKLLQASHLLRAVWEERDKHD